MPAKPLALTSGEPAGIGPHITIEAWLRRHIAAVLNGTPNYDDMGPFLANAVHQQWPQQISMYKSLGAPPNSWKPHEIFQNILEKLTPQQVQGSTWDPDSIMEYEFEKGLIAKPDKYKDGLIPPM